MATIGRFAKGFLSLLGIQNFGELPRELAPQVLSTVDIGALYLVDSQSGIFGGTTGNLVDGFNSVGPMVVPPGEVWRLHVVSVSVIPAAGATGTFAPALLLDGTAVVLADPTNYVASTRTWSVMKASPLWIPAGVEIGVLNRQTIGNSPASLQAVVSRLRA